MSTEWFYSKGDKQHGPVSASVLKSLAMSGKLLPVDLVRKADSDDWKPASSVRGLCVPSTTTAESSPSSKRSAPASGAATSPNTAPNKSSGPPPLPKTTPSLGKTAPRMMLLGAGSLVALVALCGGWFMWNANSKEKDRHATNAQSNELPSNENWNTDDSISSNSESQSNAATSSARETNVPAVQINRSPEQMQAIEAVRKLGSIFVDDTKPEEPIVKVTLARHNVKGASIRGSDLEELSTLVTLEELDIEKTSITDISHIAALKNLKVLYAPSLTPDQFEVIAALPNLQSFSCSIKKPEPGEDNPNLSVKEKRSARIDYGNQDFVRQVLSSLSKSTTLQHIRIQPSDTVHCTDESFGPFRDFAELKYLEINRFIVTDAHLSSFGESKSLVTLVLHGTNVTQNISGTGIVSLAKCQSLKRLEMGGINDDILAAVAELPSLNEFVYTHALTGREVSDTTLMRLKRDKPQLQLADSANTKTWDRVVPGKKWPLLNDMRRQEITSPNNENLLPDNESRDELVDRIQIGMSRQAVIRTLGQPDISMPIGQGQAMLYYLSETECFFISIDKSGNVFTADRQERSK